jgi:uncharacterized phage protein gp47/JayE
MARPEFSPIFEEDESAIKGRMMGRISDEWRKEPGDFMYDAVAAAPQEVQLGEIQRDFILKSAFPQFADGIFLDYALASVGLTREAATANKRQLQVLADAGVNIPKGYAALSVIADGDGNPYEFTVDEAVAFAASGTQIVKLTCVATGAATNLPNGTQFIFQPPIPGIRTITDLGTTIAGQDEESDDSAYAKYEFKVQNPDTGGNKSDYVRWANDFEINNESVVSKAKCIPRWDGNGTVKVVLLGNDFKPATAEVVAAVQTYLDPGYPDPAKMGQGEGKAPGGAAVTVEAATALNIDVAATVQLYANANRATVKAAFEATLDKYLKEIAFAEIAGDDAHNNAPVVIAKIGSLLIGTEGVANYSGLTVNGGTVDVPVAISQVAIRGAVTFN